MKKLKEIIKKDNLIHCSIHKNDRNILEDFNLNDTIESHLNREKEENVKVQPDHEALSKHYDLHQSKHRDKIKEYTNDSYTMNKSLWKEHKGKVLGPAGKRATEDVPHIDSVLNSYKTPKSIQVYSGINRNPVEQKDEHGILHHVAYLSTSLKKSKAAGFSVIQKGNTKHVLSIKVPKGSRGAYLGEHSYNPNEREFLLPRNAKLQHMGTTTREETHPIYGKINVHEHEMKWLNNK